MAKPTAALQAAALSEPDKVRITLDVTPGMKEIIDTLAKQSGASQAQVLRNAIAVLKVIKDAQASKKGEPAIVKDGRIVAELVGF